MATRAAAAARSGSIRTKPTPQSRRGACAMNERVGRGLVAAVATLACVAWVGIAAAEASPDEKRARDAYERGSAAYLRADYATAAKEFALADALAPNPTA